MDRITILAERKTSFEQHAALPRLSLNAQQPGEKPAQGHLWNNAGLSMLAIAQGCRPDRTVERRTSGSEIELSLGSEIEALRTEQRMI